MTQEYLDCLAESFEAFRRLWLEAHPMASLAEFNQAIVDGVELDEALEGGVSSQCVGGRS